MSDQYLTVEQVAEHLQVERQTVLKAIRLGRLEAAKERRAKAEKRARMARLYHASVRPRFTVPPVRALRRCR